MAEFMMLKQIHVYHYNRYNYMLYKKETKHCEVLVDHFNRVFNDKNFYFQIRDISNHYASLMPSIKCFH